MNGLPSNDVKLYLPKLLTPKQFERIVRSLKRRIIRFHYEKRQLPRIPPILRENLDGIDLWDWVQKEDDFEILREDVLIKINGHPTKK